MARARRTTSSAASGKSRSGEESRGGGAGAAAAARLPGVRRAAGQQQVGEHPEGVLVGARVGGLALRLLGRDERRGAGDHGQPRRHVERLAEAQVADHGPELASAGGPVDGAEQDVGRLDVAVQHAAVVQRLESLRHLPHHLDRLRHGQAADLEPVGQRALVGVGHDQVGAAVAELAGVVDGHHVGRLDPAQEAALFDEAGADVVVVGPVVGEHLHRDRGIELLVVGQPDRREAACPDAAADGVATQPIGDAAQGSGNF